MNALTILEHEHELILRVVAALEIWLERPGTDEAGAKLELSRFVRFFRGFVDDCHHGKEETILFSAMGDCGFPIDDGPLAVMVREHDRGRALIRALDDLAKQPATWSPGDRHRLALTVRTYAQLMRDHIHKENVVLYPMAAGHLPDEVIDSLATSFARFEARRGPGDHERFHGDAEELIARHAPQPALLHSPGGHA